MALEQRIDGIDQSIEEPDKKLEAIQKEMEDDILEFAKRMDDGWNEHRESLQKVSSGNLSTEAQLNNTKKVLIHGETKESLRI